jgi:hypothetical protein
MLNFDENRQIQATAVASGGWILFSKFKALKMTGRGFACFCVI